MIRPCRNAFRPGAGLCWEGWKERERDRTFKTVVQIGRLSQPRLLTQPMHTTNLSPLSLSCPRKKRDMIHCGHFLMAPDKLYDFQRAGRTQTTRHRCLENRNISRTKCSLNKCRGNGPLARSYSLIYSYGAQAPSRIFVWKGGVNFRQASNWMHDKMCDSRLLSSPPPRNNVFILFLSAKPPSLTFWDNPSSDPKFDPISCLFLTCVVSVFLTNSCLLAPSSPLIYVRHSHLPCS